MKFIPVIYMFFYIFGLIGIIIWNTETNSYVKDSPYEYISDKITFINFETFYGSQLILF